MNNLDNIVQTFEWAGQRYMNIMQPLAEKIFFGLVLIEVIITCIHFVADQDQPARLFAEFLKKSLALGFLYAMIVNAPTWFSAILNGFAQLGGRAAGIPGLSPSTVFGNGLAMFQAIYRGFASLGWFHLTMASLIAVIAGLIMFLSFALIAGQMLLALSEAYVGLGGGVILLGFSGSRWTIKFAENFIGWIVGVGVKLFFLYLLVGVGMTITAAWNSALSGWTVADPTLPLTIAGGALIFLLLSWEIPNVAARIAGSSVSLNLAHAFEAGMAGYGLGRILKSRDSSDAQPAATPLAQNLEAGEKATANSQALTTKLSATAPSSNGTRGTGGPSNSNATALAGGASPTTQVRQNGNRPTQQY
jgi:type IV secretion system protein TrbL